MDVIEYESGTPGGLLWLIRGGLEGLVPWDTRTLEHLYSCSTCKLCELQCYGDHAEHITDIIVTTRERLIEDGNVLPKVRDFLENVRKHGNPWGEAKSKRGDWAKGISEAKAYKPDVEFLYYVGCEGSYDPVGQRMARSLAELLAEAKVSFGILGNEEECDGNEVRLLGEVGLFKMLSQKNIEKFSKLGVKKVVTLCHRTRITHLRTNIHSLGRSCITPNCF